MQRSSMSSEDATAEPWSSPAADRDAQSVPGQGGQKGARKRGTRKNEKRDNKERLTLTALPRDGGSTPRASGAVHTLLAG